MSKAAPESSFGKKEPSRPRRGDIKSPLLRGGGVVFGPKPKSWAYNIPKKVKKLALKMALSTKYQEDQLMVLDKFDLDRVKTKDFVGIVDVLQIDNVLIVTDLSNDHLELSSRNVPGVKVIRHEGLNVYDILKYEHLVLLEASIKGIEGRLLS
jgi:large subunit ribosomal protein L4